MDEADIPFINRCLDLLDEHQRKAGSAPERKYNWLVVYADPHVAEFSHEIRSERHANGNQPVVQGHFDVVRDMNVTVRYEGSATKNYAIRLGEPND